MADVSELQSRTAFQRPHCSRGWARNTFLWKEAEDQGAKYREALRDEQQLQVLQEQGWGLSEPQLRQGRGCHQTTVQRQSQAARGPPELQQLDRGTAHPRALQRTQGLRNAAGK